MTGRSSVYSVESTSWGAGELGELVEFVEFFGFVELGSWGVGEPSG